MGRTSASHENIRETKSYGESGVMMRITKELQEYLQLLEGAMFKDCLSRFNLQLIAYM